MSRARHSTRYYHNCAKGLTEAGKHYTPKHFRRPLPQDVSNMGRADSRQDSFKYGGLSKEEVSTMTRDEMFHYLLTGGFAEQLIEGKIGGLLLMLNLGFFGRVRKDA